MNYFQLYVTAVQRPARALDEIRCNPAPLRAFKVLLFFNLLISATSTLGVNPASTIDGVSYCRAGLLPQ